MIASGTRYNNNGGPGGLCADCKRSRYTLPGPELFSNRCSTDSYCVFTHAVTKTRKLCTGAAQGTPEAQSLIRMPIQPNALYVYSQLNKIYILFNLDCTKKMPPLPAWSRE